MANRTHAAHQALLFPITLVITTRELAASIREENDLPISPLAGTPQSQLLEAPCADPGDDALTSLQ